MKVTVEYTAQVKRLAGVGSETFELDEPGTLGQLLAAMVFRHGDEFQRLLLNDSGSLQGSILLFAGEHQVSSDSNTALSDGDVLTIVTPISGG